MAGNLRLCKFFSFTQSGLVEENGHVFPRNMSDRFKVCPLVVFALILVAWELISVLGIYDPNTLPSPSRVFRAFSELATSGVLIRYAVASLFRVTVGFYLAVILGVFFGVILGVWQRLCAMFHSLIQFLRPISPLAWIPFALLWFGIGDGSAIFLIFLSSFFPMLFSTVVAVKNIPPIYFQIGANFDFSRMETFKLIVFPAILPDIVTAMRISLGVAWLVVVAAEMIAVKSGLGYLIIDSRNALRMDYVVVAMITIGVIGLVIDKAISLLQKPRFVRWKFEKK